MLSFVKRKVALWWARKHVKNSQNFKNNAVQDQENLLLSLVRKSEKTLFGRAHHFEEIRSIKDFQEKVPITDYEGLKPYIEKIKHGDRNILWPGVPEYFAKTSGTTSGTKYIPLTKEGMDFQVEGARSALLHYIAQTGNPDFVSGKMIFLQGSPELEEKNGIKIGRLSGIVAHHIPNYLQKNRLPKYETNIISDWETKVDKIVEETETENMTLISGIPPWLIMYFEKLRDRNQNKKIKEIMDSSDVYLLSEDAAKAIGVAPQNLREQAKDEPEKLGFNVIVVGTSIRIPRIPFLNYILGSNPLKGV